MPRLRSALRLSLLVPALLLGLGGFVSADEAKTAAAAKALAEGIAQREAGQHAEAQTSFDDAKKLFEEAGDPRAEVAHWYGRASSAAAAGDAENDAAYAINVSNGWLRAGKPDKAVEAARAGIALAEKAGATTWRARGSAMLSQILQQSGRHAEAIQVGEEALPLLEELGDVRGAALAAITLGKSRFATGKLGIAADDFTKGLAFARKAKFGAAILMATEWIGWSYYNLQDPKAARPYYEAGLKILLDNAARLPPERIDQAYMNLSQILRDLNEFDPLDTLVEQGLARAEVDRRPYLRAEMLMRQAEMAILEGQQRMGVRRYEEAAKLLRELGKDDRITDVYLGVGKAFARMGRAEKGIRFLQKGLRALDERKLPPTDPRDAGDRARLLLDVAGLEYRLGRFDDALETLRQARTFAGKAEDELHQNIATSLEGTIYWGLGDYDQSLALHRRALAGAEALGDRARMTSALASIGAVLSELGEVTRSAEATERALALARERKDVELELTLLQTKARLLQSSGKAAEARTLMASVLERATAFGDPTTMLRARLAVAALSERGPETIEALRAIADDAHSYRVPTVEVQARQQLAKRLFVAGDARGALAEAKAGTRELEDVFGGLGEAHGTTARARFAPLYEIGALAAAKLERPGEVFRMLEKGRAGMLVGALRARDFIDWDDLPEELQQDQAKARAEVTRAQYRVSRASRRRDLKSRRDARAGLELALAEARKVAGRVQRAAKKQADLAFPRVPPLGEIQDTLEADQAFLVLGLCFDRALAVIVTPDDERVVSLGTRRAIEQAAAAVVLDDPDQDGTASLAALRTLLVDPLKLDPTIKEVIVSPDGQLCQTPLGLLFEKQRFVMTPSATTYAHLAEEGEVERGTQVLAMGDPSYGEGASVAVASVYTRSRGVTRSGSRAGALLAALPATRPEVKAVGDVVLLGKDANETSFRKTVATRERWRAVHFACHGLVNPAAADLSALALTPNDEDDGFLTALELVQMSIPADMAVLSACETGRGQVSSGEGLLGLARSFIHAGAPRVVCSLWKVDDEATKAFMMKFYALWNPKEGKGIAPAEALRQAQVHVRSHAKWKHPYYWGAWVLWGLPR